MNEKQFIKILESKFNLYETNTRPVSNETMFKPLYNAIERTLSAEEFGKQLEVITNNLLNKHSIEITDNLISQIRKLAEDTIVKRILN